METNEIKNLEKIRKLSVRYFNTLKHIDKTNIYTAEIRVLNYYELAYVISNMLKLCIVALDPEAPEISKTVKNQSINVAVILEIVTQLLPIDEIEFLDEIHPLIFDDAEKQSNENEGL
jgi:hypothetical protein